MARGGWLCDPGGLDLAAFQTSWVQKEALRGRTSHGTPHWNPAGETRRAAGH